MGIKKGTAGLDFSESVVEDGVLTIKLKYEQEYVFNALDLASFDRESTARVKLFGYRDGNDSNDAFVSEDEESSDSDDEPVHGDETTDSEEVTTEGATESESGGSSESGSTTYKNSSDITKDIRKNKPLYSPNIDKWYSKNGTISIDENGV